jgi:hypothetical protein
MNILNKKLLNTLYAYLEGVVHWCNIRCFSLYPHTLVEDEQSFWLPSCYDYNVSKTQIIISPSNQMVSHLKDILDMLRDQYNKLGGRGEFSLDFYLFLHTNDTSKDLEFILPPSEIDVNNMDINYLGLEAARMKFLYDNYKHRGYSIIYSHKLAKEFWVGSKTLNGVNNQELALLIGNKLVRDVGNFNRNEDLKGFYEFKKFVLLKVRFGKIL